jgi:hypothetical protein
MDAAVRTLFKASKPEYQKQEDERKKRVGNGLTSNAFAAQGTVLFCLRSHSWPEISGGGFTQPAFPGLKTAANG